MKYIVSVIIPIYNTAEYLCDCLDSILCANRIEQIQIILVDDGSSDDSVQIALKYTAHYKNISFFQQSHLGVSAARNLGLSKATGEYLWFVDSDDMINPSILKVLFGLSSITMPDVIEFNSYRFSDSLDLTNNMFFQQSNLCDKCKDVGRFNNGSRLFKRSIVVDNNIKFYEGMSFGEDTLFLIEFNEKSDTRCVLSDIGYLYRTSRPGSAIDSVGKRMSEWLQCILLSAEYVKDKFEKEEFSRIETIIFLRNKITQGLDIMSNIQKNEAKQYLKKFVSAGLLPYVKMEDFGLTPVYPKYYYESKRRNQPPIIKRILHKIKNWREK